MIVDEIHGMLVDLMVKHWPHMENHCPANWTIEELLWELDVLIEYIMEEE